MTAHQLVSPKALFRRGRFERAVAATRPYVVRGWGEAETGDDWFLADTELSVRDVPITRVRGGQVLHHVEQQVVIPPSYIRVGGKLYDAVDIHLGDHDDPVVEVFVPGREPGTTRRVFRFSYLDRVCQRLILQVLDAQIDPLLPTHLHSFRRGRDRWSAARDLRGLLRGGHVYVQRTDIRQFFDVISVDVAMEALTQVLPQLTPAFLDLVACTPQRRVLRRPNHPGRRDGTLPPESAPWEHLLQGAILSPILSNVVGAVAIDRPFAAALGEASTLVRYADDIVLATRTESDCARAFGVLHDLVAAQGWHLHPRKTSGIVDVRRNPVTWLGIEFHGTRARLPENRFQEYVARLAEADQASPNFPLIARGILGEFRLDRPHRADDLYRAVRRRSPAQAAALRQVMASRQKHHGQPTPLEVPLNTPTPRDLPEAPWS
jgi:hypothetical protein